MFLAVVTLAIVTSLLFDIWLDRRQIRHVLAHRDQVPPAFRDMVSIEDHRKAAAYTAAKRRFGMKRDVADAILSFGLLVGGGFAFVHATLVATLGTGYGASLVLVGVIALIGAVASLPFDCLETFSIEQQFGFNRMTRRLFVIDRAKSIALAILFMTPLLLAVDYAMRQLGSWWWLAVWGIFIAFNLLALLIVPTFILPLFNRLEPLDDAALKARIGALMERCGFHSEGVFRMDGSKRSSHGNAFFTGLGPSKRIVLFDTLLEKLTPGEIEAVLAHELGHFRLRHIAQRMVVFFGVSLVLLAFLGWLAGQAWFYRGFGVDPAMAQAMPLTSLLLFFLVFPLVSKWFRAISSHFSRLHEFEADAYAARQANARELASALVKLHRDNASTLIPDPIYAAVNDSHPSAAQRIARLARP
jgi:STE24 endopeptidase